MMDAKRTTTRPIIIKLPTVNDKEVSSQDGGIGRHTVPPLTTKRRTTI